MSTIPESKNAVSFLLALRKVSKDLSCYEGPVSIVGKVFFEDNTSKDFEFSADTRGLSDEFIDALNDFFSDTQAQLTRLIIQVCFNYELRRVEKISLDIAQDPFNN